MEARLIEALQPIRHFALAANLYHLFETGLYDDLACAVSIEALGEKYALDRERLSAFLTHLANEGYLSIEGGRVELSTRGRDLSQFRGWYTMLIGGYARTFLELGEKLSAGSGAAARNGAKVGIGSADISQYDTNPLIRALFGRRPGGVRRFLDLGCGNARHLVGLLEQSPELEYICGVEPSEGAVASARAMIKERGAEQRIRVVCSGALEFLAAPDVDAGVDAVLLTFVLQEILGQEGEAATIEFLRRVHARFPGAHLLIIEVDQRHADPRVMRHGLALAYYNPYFLLHPFTQQRLESSAYWERLFAEAGLAVVARETTDPRVDSTGLTVGFLLGHG